MLDNNLFVINRRLETGEDLNSYLYFSHYKRALVLKDYGDELLVAIFSRYQSNTPNKTFVLKKEVININSIQEDLRFNGIIYLVSRKDLILNLGKIDDLVVDNFVKKLSSVDFKVMDEFDFGALKKYLITHNKCNFRRGSVVYVKDELCKDSVGYFILDLVDDGFIGVRVKYDYQRGLYVYSNQREFVSYGVYPTDLYYTSMQEEKIKKMLL